MLAHNRSVVGLVARASPSATLCRCDGLLFRFDTRRHFQMYPKKQVPILGKPVKKKRYFWDFDSLEQQTDGEYTHKPLRVPRLGGRDPKTGRVVNDHIGRGGGTKFRWDYFMLDTHRYRSEFDSKLVVEDSPDVLTSLGETAPQVKYYAEQVLHIRRDLTYTPCIAMVVGMWGRRWLRATEEGMKAGDIIRTYVDMPLQPRKGKPGDCHRLGALVPGTVVSCIEQWEGSGSNLLVNAYSQGTIKRHTGDGRVVINTPMKRQPEMMLSAQCFATVGRLSGRRPEGYITTVQEKTFLGWKPAHGPEWRKGGYQGRKVYVKSMKVIDGPPEPPPKKCSFTFKKEDLNCQFGQASLNQLLNEGGYQSHGSYD